MLSTFEFDFCMIILMSDLIIAPRPYSDEELAELELQEHAYTDEEKEELSAGKTFFHYFQSKFISFCCLLSHFERDC